MNIVLFKKALIKTRSPYKVRRALLITKEYWATSFLLSLPFGYSVLTTSAVSSHDAPYTDSRMFIILTT